jgi:hypothetical protein
VDRCELRRGAIGGLDDRRCTLESRPIRPATARRPRLWRVREPEFQALVGLDRADPTITIGRSIATSRKPGFACQAASEISRPASAVAIMPAAARRPAGVRSASSSQLRSNARSPAR